MINDPLREKTEAEIQVQDLAAIVRKLLRHVPDDVAFKEKAVDYLRRKGLAGNVLRNARPHRKREPVTPYEIVGVTADGVKLLKPARPPTNFTEKEIAEAIAFIRQSRRDED